MSDYKLILAVVILVLSPIALTELVIQNKTNQKIVFDCRLAEISPDFPIAVKEECRKRLSGRI